MFIFLINLESSRLIMWLADHWNAGPFLALGGSTGYRCINRPLTRKCSGFKRAGCRMECLLITPSFFPWTLPLVEARVVCLVYIPFLPLSSPIPPDSQLSAVGNRTGSQWWEAGASERLEIRSGVGEAEKRGFGSSGVPTGPFTTSHVRDGEKGLSLAGYHILSRSFYFKESETRTEYKTRHRFPEKPTLGDGHGRMSGLQPYAPPR